MWQADHSKLPILLLDAAGKPAKPWLTVIEDDYSRMIASYRLSFHESSALTTALALRQAIWRKSDPHWHICGIPSTFYTDHGPDFTSKHLEQVADDLDMVLIFSEKGEPRGRGKVERFFRSVEQLLLQDPWGAKASRRGILISEIRRAACCMTISSIVNEQRTARLSLCPSAAHASLMPGCIIGFAP